MDSDDDDLFPPRRIHRLAGNNEDVADLGREARRGQGRGRRPGHVRGHGPGQDRGRGGRDPEDRINHARGRERGRGERRGRHHDGGNLDRGRGQHRFQDQRHRGDVLQERIAQGERGRGYRGRGRGRGLDFRQLQDLREKDPSTILASLGLESGLNTFLRRSHITAFTMFTLLDLICKACSCTSAPANVSRLFLTIQESSFFEHVTTVLRQIQHRPHEHAREYKQFIKDLLTFLQSLSIRLPHTYTKLEVLGAEAFLDTLISDLEMRSDIIDDEILDKKNELAELKTSMFNRIRDVETSSAAKDAEGDPPNDFKDLPIFPDTEDLNPDERPFLRKNKAVGGYRDLTQYLDVQFRLLREDFICPLRDGIEEYIAATVSGGKTHKLKDIRVYHDVQIMRTVCSDSGLLHRISFDVSKLKRVRWENSKRLIFGSLVCLSTDNFETYLFATISDRDPKKLCEGIVDVLIENTDETMSSAEERYVMVETTAYFEAYRHVLKGLQQIGPGDLPFERYIVSCENEVEPPKYLRDIPNPKYDLRPLVDEKVVLREDVALRQQHREVSYDFSRESFCASKIEILDHREWPSAQALHLDMSQYKAIKTALTKEFVITQGPPGTGKTYVGLKIVKALLHNAKLWNSTHKTPMLIVCYTNHALDQFLEGIVSFFKGNVIRVGGRMVSETLKDYSLREHKQRARRTRGKDIRITGRMRWETRQRMLDLRLKIERIGQQIEAAELEILHEDVLRPFMGHHYDEMTVVLEMMFMQMADGSGAPALPGSAIVEWLGIGVLGEEAFPMAGDAQAEEEEEDLDDEGLDIQEEADIEQQQRRMHDLDDIVDDDSDIAGNGIQDVKRLIENIVHEKGRYVAFDISSLDKAQAKEKRNKGAFQLQRKAKRTLKRKLLRRLRSTDKMTSIEANRVIGVWNLQIQERWKLYRYWIHQLCGRLQGEISQAEVMYRQVVAQYKESQMLEDKQVLETATVIGMTTTGAARYQGVLSEIGPKIIVVEEAAEVLEGHIITTLSKKCQHLILIGDHKQLKPNPTVYKLAKRYNLDLSLFERMIDNGIHCDTLALQHRMRPEIAVLMKHIYPKLENHSSVENYETVKGVSKNMFFVNHGVAEQHDTELTSHSNEFEAKYVVALCEYLLKQGYQKSQITVLTTYSGQLFTLKKMMPKTQFQGVRLTVVDNYQGEENDIIILSLVRSNAEGSVGFLKIENRVCVALSRAKRGLFVIGNFDLLSQQSQLWKDIVKDLRRREMIGTSLKLYCQNHKRDEGIDAKKPEDFKKAPEGGCMKPCTYRLDCGHVCARLCHPYDPKHEEYKCAKPCPKKICKYDHPCKRRCYQECTDCEELVEKLISKCGHLQMVPCSLSPLKFICQEKCEKMLDCGHLCGNHCGVEHRCTNMVKKTWRCGHNGTVECSRKDTVKCSAQCTHQLTCEHKCGGNCKTCHEGRLHVPCTRSCKRTLVCGHECGDRCSNCPPCKKACENRCSHSKCHKTCGERCAPCNEPCSWRCEHYQCTRKCSEPCDRPPCHEPCKLKLKCGHPCIGLCGEPCPRLCRVCNEADVTTIFFGTEDEADARFVELEDCRHIVEVSSLDKWMELDSTEGIQLKACPQCKTQIRRNVRYGKAIKSMLKDIERVKKQQLGKKDRIKALKAQLDTEVEMTTRATSRRQKQTMLEHGWNFTETGLNAIQNQFRFLDRISKLTDQVEEFKLEIEEQGQKLIATDTIFCMKEIELFRDWLTESRFILSAQEASDAQNELLRLRATLRLLKIEKSISTGSLKLPDPVQLQMEALKGILKYGKPYTSDRQSRAKSIFDALKEHVKAGLAVTEEERVQIVQAIGLGKGQWFKCPNGHFYAIGECGGATEEGRCPECNARIGGTDHRLRNDNALAPEMDGAQYAAWSDRANMNNYDLDDVL